MKGKATISYISKQADKKMQFKAWDDMVADECPEPTLSSQSAGNSVMAASNPSAGNRSNINVDSEGSNTSAWVVGAIATCGVATETGVEGNGTLLMLMGHDTADWAFILN